MYCNQYEPLEGKAFCWNAYIEKLISYLEKEHLCDEKLWAVFVDQFRKHTGEGWLWNGEYWGKSMRGAAMIYRCTQNERLYHVLKNSVLDLLSTQGADGRISTYIYSQEFTGWDMWCRKYVLLGSLYFYEICKEEELKRNILSAMEKHLDYIVERIGEGEGKKSVFETSICWGALNSCSILEPVVKMYQLTNKDSYLAFAKYLAATGFGQSEDFIEVCYTKSKYPYQFETTKAYEMMSCFQGLLELYTVTGEEKFFTATVNFADMMQESEITIIGCAGCQGEFLDNSANTQTEYSDEEMQETCVTVTWMNLCYRLLQMTGNAKYADWIEQSALNALNGSVNIENQLTLQGKIMDYRVNPMVLYQGKRRVLPFDSYSPLVYNRRGKLIGGFNIMEGEEIYGCCACIGGLGLAIEELFGVMKTQRGFAFNLYENAAISTEYRGIPVTMKQITDLEKSPYTTIQVSAGGKFELAFRIPYWTDGYEVQVDGVAVDADVRDGYLCITREWSENYIELYFNTELRTIELNGKIAFCKAGYVLARTQEMEQDIRTAVGKVRNVSVVEEKPFKSDILLNVQTDKAEIFLCDYAHAGKKFDEENCNITVWCDRLSFCKD